MPVLGPGSFCGKVKYTWGDNSPLEDCLALGKGSLGKVAHVFLLLEYQEKMLANSPQHAEKGVGPLPMGSC